MVLYALAQSGLHAMLVRVELQHPASRSATLPPHAMMSDYSDQYYYGHDGLVMRLHYVALVISPTRSMIHTGMRGNHCILLSCPQCVIPTILLLLALLLIILACPLLGILLLVFTVYDKSIDIKQHEMPI